jgi:hypothetical protein
MIFLPILVLPFTGGVQVRTGVFLLGHKILKKMCEKFEREYSKKCFSGGGSNGEIVGPCLSVCLSVWGGPESLGIFVSRP